jgi:hypothetical protein
MEKAGGLLWKRHGREREHCPDELARGREEKTGDGVVVKGITMNPLTLSSKSKRA